MLLPACVAKPDEVVVNAAYTGEYGVVREELIPRVHDNKPTDATGDINRNYILDQMRLTIATLADGYALPRDQNIESLYDLLRRQGVNSDKTVQSVVINEDLKVWKGEPFEQALAFTYIGVYYAMQDSWDNARAAVINSLFQLKSFGSDGQVISNEQAINRAQQTNDSDMSNYVAVKSDFALGYLMAGIANQQMYNSNGDPDRLDEARSYYNQTARLVPQLQPLINAFLSNKFNTILFVDFGKGPTKIASGPDNAVSSYASMTPSDSRRLVVMSGNFREAVPRVCDVNVMAYDHRWNNLEDMRVAKSIMGTVLLGGGAVVTAVGAERRDLTVAAVGLGLMALGAVAKAGAHADTRHCEAMPQRVYVVAVNITAPNSSVALEVEGDPGARTVLTGLSPPTGRTAQLRYVRLVYWPGNAAYWARAGKIVYSNDRTGEAPGPQLPYILGGYCVRYPTQEALDSYHRSGYLLNLNLSDLKQLYRQEGIRIDPQDVQGTPGKHILEGGDCLFTPQSGTLGFSRLFGEVHQPYVPKSDAVRKLADSVQFAQPAAR